MVAGGATGQAWAWAALYLATGVAQPLLTDAVKYHGGTHDWPPTLLPLLANTLGMAAVVPLTKAVRALRDWAWKNEYEPVAGTGASRGGAKDVFQDVPLGVLGWATAIDLASGVLTTSGLLMVGSGIYTVIYSSTTAWTAILSWLAGSQLETGQWLGIMLVSLGLAMNALGIMADSAADTPQHRGVLLTGVTVLLMGTVLHAAAFVYNERAIKTAYVSPFQLCAQIGAVESLVVIVYNSFLVLCSSTERLYTDDIEAAGSSLTDVLLAYATLSFTNALHACAFFAMLGQLGAVSMGVLKSVLAISVFSFAAVFFCSYEASQCFSAFKAAAMSIVLFGSFAFMLSSKKASRRKTTV